MPDTSGPHLSTAVICERVLTEADGVASIIRIIDRLFLAANEDGEPVDSQFQFTIFVSFKSGAARGNYTIGIDLEKPSGESAHLAQAPVLFEGEERGVNFVSNVNFKFDQQGLYWFDITFEGNRVTRIPLRVIYQQMPTAGPGGLPPMPPPG